MNRQDRGCQSKKAYLAEIDALVVARKRESSGAPTLRTYRCDFCGFWHLTKGPIGMGHTAPTAGGT